MPTVLPNGRGTVWTASEFGRYSKTLKFGRGATAAMKGGGVDFQKMLAGVNRLIDALNPGAKLPDTVDESNFNIVFPVFVNALCGPEQKAEDEPNRHETFTEAMNNAPVLKMSARFGSSRKKRLPSYEPSKAQLAEARRAYGLK